MANKRIKDLTQTATTLANDDYVAIDGSSNGTRKIVKSDLVNDISSQVAGTYLDEANNLSDVASLDTSKLNLEVPDVGTAPNEVPLNGMLGDMAYQSSEGISVAKLEVTDKIDLSGAPTQQLEVYGDAPTVRVTDTSDTVADGESIGKLEFYGNDGSSGGPNVRTRIDTVSEGAAGNHYGLAISTSASNAAPAERLRIDSQGRVGVSQTSPGSYNANANNLVVGTGSGSEGMTIASGTTGEGGIYFADGTTGNQQYRGYLGYGHTNDELFFGTEGVTKWKLNSTGNLVPQSSGLGIDFGAVASGTGTVTPTTGGLLDDYETGTWTPVFAPDSGSFATATTHVNSAKYTKIGNVVTANCYIRSDGTLDTTGGSGTVQIHGLPFTSAANSSISVSVGYAYGWSAAPAGGYVMGNNNKILLTKRYSTTDGHLIGGSVSDLNTSGGSNNQIMISVTYQTA